MIKEAEAVVEGGTIIDVGVNIKMSILADFFDELWYLRG